MPTPLSSTNRDMTKYEYAEISFLDKILSKPMHSILDQMKEQSSDDKHDKPNKSVRRSHRKSRAGCGNCKRRRIKVSFISLMALSPHPLLPYMI